MVSNRESMWFLLFMVFIAGWRKVLKKSCVQAPLHRILGNGAVVLQWYTLFFVGCICYSLLAVVQFFMNVAFMPDSEVEQNLQTVWQESKIKNETSFEEFKASLDIPMWLYVLNVIGQLSGLVVVGLVIYHCVWFLLVPSHRAAQQDATWEAHAWMVPKRINWLIWIIILPSVFSIEMLFANNRVWSIMLGTADEYKFASFKPAHRLETLYIHEDVQFATIFQFTAIYAFTRLISDLYENTAIIKGHSDEVMQKLAKEYKRLLRLGGFLGIWLYIAAGVVRAVIIVGITLVLQLKVIETHDVSDETVLWMEDLEEAFVGMIGITFTLLTILSVINMVIMTQSYIIAEKLGDRQAGEHDVNKKFLGARVLLICSEVVPKVIDVFEVGTAMHEQTKTVTGFLRFLYLNTEQAEILKITVLSIACVVAVIMNFVFWRNCDCERAGLLDFRPKDATQNISSMNSDGASDGLLTS